MSANRTDIIFVASPIFLALGAAAVTISNEKQPVIYITFLSIVLRAVSMHHRMKKYLVPGIVHHSW